MYKRALLQVIFFGALTFAAFGQTPVTPATTVDSEPHHKLLLQNDKVRVYRLELAKNKATSPHRHAAPYVFIALTPATIANEVHGRASVVSTLEYGELRSSKGGFTVAERNAGSEPLSLIVVEMAGEVNRKDAFPSPEADFRMRNAAVGHLFETNDWRGYEMDIASEGTIGSHNEDNDRLIVAISEVHLRNDVEGKGSTRFDLAAGEVAWVAGKESVSSVNLGADPARFVVIEVR